MSFDPATLEKLRGILKTKRERYDFAFTMNRWAEIICRKDRVKPRSPLYDECTNRTADDDEFFRPVGDDEFVQDINEEKHVAHLLVLPPGAPIPNDSEPLPRKRRPRVDLERWAALVLAVIFYEYTKTKPTRITYNVEFADRANTRARDKTAPFYKFAEVAFEAVGLKPSGDVFREATERRWARQGKTKRQQGKKRGEPWSVRSIRKLLWGGLPKATDVPPNMAWPERQLQRRKNSLP